MAGRDIVVEIAGKPAYAVQIGKGVLRELGARARRACPKAAAAFIVTDDNVAPLYLRAAQASLQGAGLPVETFIAGAGEESKSVACLERLWQVMAQAHLGRDACVVALGGGVVGDLAGFAAATYMRGVFFVQVPTTLLAMVDSSVGGKTAVNLPEGKNLAGSFYQPSYVCADTEVLSTLDEREWVCGCGEVTKSAALDGAAFFDWLRVHARALALRDSAATAEVIERCVDFKAGIVARDEQENSGVRECLNLGHTLGHAIEKLAGYGAYSHGAAVAEGVRFSAQLAEALCGADSAFTRELGDLLDRLGCTRLPFSAQPTQLMEVMRADKKNRAGEIRFVLLREPGAWEVRRVEEDLLEEQLAAWARSKA